MRTGRWIAVVLALFVALGVAAPSHANHRLRHGGTASGPVSSPGVAGDANCSYIATGPGVYASSGVSQWTVIVRRGGTVVFQVLGDGRSTTTRTGTVPSRAGDHVTVGLRDRCPPLQGECRPLGAISAMDQ